MKDEINDSDSVGSSLVDFILDDDKIRGDYEKNTTVYEALREEIVFILNDIVCSSGIKIHGIESRVKELDSLIGKCLRKRTNEPMSDINDIAAARVICLFRSDVDRLTRLISEKFDVIFIDDKIHDGADPLNYLSVHLVCQMKNEYSGPRYHKVMNINFEIQLRTLCMHCWATVSHYVDYKGDWDVPSNLKMALSALSGLFYVADNEFEQFNAAMVASKTSAQRNENTASKLKEINLDTLSAFLRRIFPNRRSADSSGVSALVNEIKMAGYTDMETLESDIYKGLKAVERYEKSNRSGKIYFKDIGAARQSLSSVSEKFKEIQDEKFGRKNKGGLEIKA